MSALSVLFLVLPFPIAIALHKMEEAFIMPRWMAKHKDELLARYPKYAKQIKLRALYTTKSIATKAAFEVTAVIVLTCCMLVNSWISTWVLTDLWSFVFILFSLHLVCRIVQSIVLRRYVPGLVTSILAMPLIVMGMHSIWLTTSAEQLCVLFAISIYSTVRRYKDF